MENPTKSVPENHKMMLGIVEQLKISISWISNFPYVDAIPIIHLGVHPT